MSQPEHVLVVGAGLAGLRTLERLRELGFQGRLSLVGDERHAPYDRPPLSKQVLTGAWPPERTTLRSLEGLDELGVRAYLGLRAVGLRPGAVLLEDGSALHADAIVVATGLRARTLPGQPEQVHTLRTLDDAVALRAALLTAGSLVVVGGGFIGAEVASSARDLGVAVTVLEAQSAPSVRALGPELGALTGRLMTEAGVDLRTNAEISTIAAAGTGAAAGNGHVAGNGAVAGNGVVVELGDGTRVEADVAVVGIGGVPRLEWLSDAPASGLPCGPTGRVEGEVGVWAVGDVAAWADPTHGGRHRHEHWTSAGDQATAVARDILGEPPAAAPVPYFWSDQFGMKIQLIGRPEDAGALLPLHGDGLDGGPVRGTVVGLLAGERLVAVAGFGAARWVVRYRALLQAGADGTAARDHAAALEAQRR